MTSEIQDLVDAHLAIWNSTDPAVRSGAMPRVYADGVRVGEADASYDGYDGMDAAIRGLQGALPGMRLSLASDIQQAQNMVTYRWNLGNAAEESVVVTGRDVLMIEDGVVAALYVVIDS